MAGGPHHCQTPGLKVHTRARSAGEPCRVGRAPVPCPGVHRAGSPSPNPEKSQGQSTHPGGSRACLGQDATQRLTMFMTVRMNLWAASAPWYRTMSASATTRVSTVCSFVSWMAFLRSRQSRDGLPLRGFFFSRKRQRHPCRPWHFDFQNHTAKRPSAKPPVENGQSPMARSWTSTITGQ